MLEENDYMQCSITREAAGLSPECIDSGGFMPTGTVGCDSCGKAADGMCHSKVQCEVVDGLHTQWSQEPIAEAVVEPIVEPTTEPTHESIAEDAENLNDLIKQAVGLLGNGNAELPPEGEPEVRAPRMTPVIEEVVMQSTAGSTGDSKFEELFQTACVNAKKVKTDLDKADAGKLMWHLLPRGVLRYMAAVMTYGSIKYSENGWQDVVSANSRYSDAAERHRDAVELDGEIFDKESGLPHCVHELTNHLFKCYFELIELGLL